MEPIRTMRSNHRRFIRPCMIHRQVYEGMLFIQTCRNDCPSRDGDYFAQRLETFLIRSIASRMFSSELA